MPEVSIIMIDNGIQSQNQDYQPNRLLIQTEMATRIIDTILEISTQEQVGIIPLYQQVCNDILTPISANKAKLLHFVSRIDLSENNTIKEAFYQVRNAMKNSELSSEKIFMFLSSTIDEPYDLIFEIGNLLNSDMSVFIICFGDALGFVPTLLDELPGISSQLITINRDEDFEFKCEQFIFSKINSEDEELKLAIAKSLLEK